MEKDQDINKIVSLTHSTGSGIPDKYLVRSPQEIEATKEGNEDLQVLIDSNAHETTKQTDEPSSSGSECFYQLAEKTISSTDYSSEKVVHPLISYKNDDKTHRNAVYSGSDHQFSSVQILPQYQLKHPCSKWTSNSDYFHSQKTTDEAYKAVRRSDPSNFEMLSAQDASEALSAHHPRMQSGWTSDSEYFQPLTSREETFQVDSDYSDPSKFHMLSAHDDLSASEAQSAHHSKMQSGWTSNSEYFQPLTPREETFQTDSGSSDASNFQVPSVHDDTLSTSEALAMHHSKKQHLIPDKPSVLKEKESIKNEHYDSSYGVFEEMTPHSVQSFSASSSLQNQLHSLSSSKPEQRKFVEQISHPVIQKQIHAHLPCKDSPFYDKQDQIYNKANKINFEHYKVQIPSQTHVPLEHISSDYSSFLSDQTHLNIYGQIPTDTISDSIVHTGRLPLGSSTPSGLDKAISLPVLKQYVKIKSSEIVNLPNTEVLMLTQQRREPMGSENTELVPKIMDKSETSRVLSGNIPDKEETQSVESKYDDEITRDLASFAFGLSDKEKIPLEIPKERAAHSVRPPLIGQSSDMSTSGSYGQPLSGRSSTSDSMQSGISSENRDSLSHKVESLLGKKVVLSKKQSEPQGLPLPSQTESIPIQIIQGHLEEKSITYIQPSLQEKDLHLSSNLKYSEIKTPALNTSLVETKMRNLPERLITNWTSSTHKSLLIPTSSGQANISEYQKGLNVSADTYLQERAIKHSKPDVYLHQMPKNVQVIYTPFATGSISSTKLKPFTKSLGPSPFIESGILETETVPSRQQATSKPSIIFGHSMQSNTLSEGPLKSSSISFEQSDHIQGTKTIPTSQQTASKPSMSFAHSIQSDTLSEGPLNCSSISFEPSYHIQDAKTVPSSQQTASKPSMSFSHSIQSDTLSEGPLKCSSISFESSYHIQDTKTIPSSQQKASKQGMIFGPSIQSDTLSEGPLKSSNTSFEPSDHIPETKTLPSRQQATSNSNVVFGHSMQSDTLSEGPLKSSSISYELSDHIQNTLSEGPLTLSTCSTGLLPTGSGLSVLPLSYNTYSVEDALSEGPLSLSTQKLSQIDMLNKVSLQDIPQTTKILVCDYDLTVGHETIMASAEYSSSSSSNCSSSLKHSEDSDQEAERSLSEVTVSVESIVTVIPATENDDYSSKERLSVEKYKKEKIILPTEHKLSADQGNGVKGEVSENPFHISAKDDAYRSHNKQYEFAVSSDCKLIHQSSVLKTNKQKSQYQSLAEKDIEEMGRSDYQSDHRTSPTSESSFASSKRLEWDNGADIGYGAVVNVLSGLEGASTPNFAMCIRSEPEGISLLGKDGIGATTKLQIQSSVQQNSRTFSAATCSKKTKYVAEEAICDDSSASVKSSMIQEGLYGNKPNDAQNITHKIHETEVVQKVHHILQSQLTAAKQNFCDAAVQTELKFSTKDVEVQAKLSFRSRESPSSSIDSVSSESTVKIAAKKVRKKAQHGSKTMTLSSPLSEPAYESSNRRKILSSSIENFETSLLKKKSLSLPYTAWPSEAVGTQKHIPECNIASNIASTSGQTLMVNRTFASNSSSRVSSEKNILNEFTSHGRNKCYDNMTNTEESSESSSEENSDSEKPPLNYITDISNLQLHLPYPQQLLPANISSVFLLDESMGYPEFLGEHTSVSELGENIVFIGGSGAERFITEDQADGPHIRWYPVTGKPNSQDIRHAATQTAVSYVAEQSPENETQNFDNEYDQSGGSSECSTSESSKISDIMAYSEYFKQRATDGLQYSESDALKDYDERLGFRHSSSKNHIPVNSSDSTVIFLHELGKEINPSQHQAAFNEETIPKSVPYIKKYSAETSMEYLSDKPNFTYASILHARKFASNSNQFGEYITSPHNENNYSNAVINNTKVSFGVSDIINSLHMKSNSQSEEQGSEASYPLHFSNMISSQPISSEHLLGKKSDVQMQNFAKYASQNHLNEVLPSNKQYAYQALQNSAYGNETKYDFAEKSHLLDINQHQNNQYHPVEPKLPSTSSSLSSETENSAAKQVLVNALPSDREKCINCTESDENEAINRKLKSGLTQSQKSSSHFLEPVPKTKSKHPEQNVSSSVSSGNEQPREQLSVGTQQLFPGRYLDNARENIAVSSNQNRKTLLQTNLSDNKVDFTAQDDVYTGVHQQHDSNELLYKRHPSLHNKYILLKENSLSVRTSEMGSELQETGSAIVHSTAHSETMESTHSGSDDAMPPKFPSHVLGSREQPSIPGPGVYGNRKFAEKYGIGQKSKVLDNSESTENCITDKMKEYTVHDIAKSTKRADRANSSPSLLENVRSHNGTAAKITHITEPKKIAPNSVTMLHDKNRLNYINSEARAFDSGQNEERSISTGNVESASSNHTSTAANSISSHTTVKQIDNEILSTEEKTDKSNSDSTKSSSVKAKETSSRGRTKLAQNVRQELDKLKHLVDRQKKNYLRRLQLEVERLERLEELVLNQTLQFQSLASTDSLTTNSNMEQTEPKYLSSDMSDHALNRQLRSFQRLSKSSTTDLSSSTTTSKSTYRHSQVVAVSVLKHKKGRSKGTHFNESSSDIPKQTITPTKYKTNLKVHSHISKKKDFGQSFPTPLPSDDDVFKSRKTVIKSIAVQTSDSLLKIKRTGTVFEGNERYFVSLPSSPKSKAKKEKMLNQKSHSVKQHRSQRLASPKYTREIKRSIAWSIPNNRKHRLKDSLKSSRNFDQTLQGAFHKNCGHLIRRSQSRLLRVARLADIRSRVTALALERARLVTYSNERIACQKNAIGEQPQKKTLTHKEIRDQTEKIYKKLPEVVQMKEKKKQEDQYQTNRLMAQMYKKKLQEQVLKGKVNWTISQTCLTA